MVFFEVKYTQQMLIFFLCDTFHIIISTSAYQTDFSLKDLSVLMHYG